MRPGKYKLGGSIVKRGLISGQCRVLSCRFYHKNIKDLKRHLERSHSMTLASHNKLPPSLLSSVIKKNKGKSHMKHRKVELCSIKGCKHYMQPQTDLTRHLKNCHNGMTKKQYYAKRKPRIVDEDGPSEKPLINVSCNVSLINDSVITAIEDQDDIPADSSQMYHNVEDFSDCERSDLLDSDCTLSPFYPPSEYEEIIQSDSEDHDSYLTKRYL
uniref:C2H2-type domain-containing protein n=2 Tax=Clytia hemisphaerica TaxID=252671 RepID=A0A7M5WZV9_9CNID